ncbi:hypothetical protein F4861DRAFT_543407 [Xylaria intraflava]|nr:hypothetical protein F4861DRAFT_543407 [Xylaria intraflava]
MAVHSTPAWRFSIDGFNGYHACLVQESAGRNIPLFKEDTINFMFPGETLRSIASQLIMAIPVLWNILLCGTDLNHLSPNELYERYRLDMGRGDALKTCQWDLKRNEMRALEELLRAMTVFEPAESLTAEQLMGSKYIVK